MANHKAAFFITGTDTDVGKTYVAQALVQHFVAQGKTCIGMKPIAAGCELVSNKWLNQDVAQLMAASNIKAPLSQVNPYAFVPAIAPHIAAEQAGVAISLDTIFNAYAALQDQAEIVIVEGAGGFFVPINAHQTTADLAEKLNIPVILVVGIRLGCINHALLTAQAIEAQGLSLAGWVANHISPEMPALEDNISTLKRLIKAPCIADVAWGEVPIFAI